MILSLLKVPYRRHPLAVEYLMDCRYGFRRHAPSSPMYAARLRIHGRKRWSQSPPRTKGHKQGCCKDMVRSETPLCSRRTTACLLACCIVLNKHCAGISHGTSSRPRHYGPLPFPKVATGYHSSKPSEPCVEVMQMGHLDMLSWLSKSPNDTTFSQSLQWRWAVEVLCPLPRMLSLSSIVHISPVLV